MNFKKQNKVEKLHIKYPNQVILCLLLRKKSFLNGWNEDRETALMGKGFQNITQWYKALP